MKAWQLRAHGAPEEVLELAELELPPPGAGEIRLRVRAAALGLPDVMMCEGRYEYAPALPFTPGQEVCGTVEAVGDGAGFEPGQRLAAVTLFFNGQGGFAEQAMTHCDMAYPLPDSMPDVAAAGFIIPFQTAWAALVSRGALRSGETLLVLGAAGSSGSAAIQLGRALGARVIAVARGETRAAACREFGADEVIDSEREDFVAAVAQLTDNAGVDLVFDPVGGETCRRAAASLARDGRILLVGFAAGDPCLPGGRQLLLANVTVMGVFVGGYTPAERRGMHEALLDLYRAGRIAPPLAGPIAFEDIPRGLSRIADRSAVGKLVAELA